MGYTSFMKKVDFFIVGQAKSGTTALADFLSQHPEIFMSFPKEPAFFATDIVRESDRFHGKKVYFKTRSLQQYINLFAKAEPNQLLGEASTSYIYSKEAAKNIRAYNPNAKIIILLRNPADFLHSLHMQYVNETVENEIDFKKAIKLEEQRRKGKALSKRVKSPSLLFYYDRIKYFEQIKRFFDNFSKDNIFVSSSEEFMSNNAQIYRAVLEFLDVKDTSFSPNFGIVHGSKTSRNRIVNSVLHIPKVKNVIFKLVGMNTYMKLRGKVMPILMKNTSREKLDPQIRSLINNEARADIVKLDRLLQTDFVNLWNL